MSLVLSLLQAIVSVDGEALVMHAGDKPYVVAPSGQVELASKGLSLDAVNGVVAQLLPADAFSALEEFGAIQHELAAQAGFTGESFTVVAARGGDDLWVEIRRRKISDDDGIPDDLFAGSIPPDQALAGEPVSASPVAPPGARPIARPVAATSPALTLQSDPGVRAPVPPAASVQPLARSPIRMDTPAPVAPPGGSGLDRLLRMAAARGASTLYLSSHARPSIRVDGEIQMFEGEPPQGPNDVESLLLTMMPERSHEALRSGQATEWIADLDGVGRVRCLSFRDHRGPGGVFRMMPVRAVSAEQLGLTREVQSLAMEPEGLVLVAGPRLSGKRTMISAFVDLMNRTRRDHVITIENEINVVHERGTSFVSQREVRGNFDDVESVARAALREDPDVIVIESMRTAPLVNVALEAAASGQLVIGGFPAHDTTAALDRIINLYPPEYRRQVQLALAENLRGVVAQVLVRKKGGGRLAAREILLNNSTVAGIIAEGRTSQLPIAIEGARRQGMQPLNDALAGLVQSGSVDVREAHRHAADRDGFLTLLKRLGMDTALIERAG
jgi:twitching motility protein PilT